MSWCKASLARSRRLKGALAEAQADVERRCTATGKPARVFRDFEYRTHHSWNRTRRAIGKAKHTLEGANPRFVVTPLKCTRVAYDARTLYEVQYCVRGEVENSIGAQSELLADRASTATLQGNQLRMWFTAMAHALIEGLRRLGLRDTKSTDAVVTTIRFNLLKLCARVVTSVRRIHFTIASGCPNKVAFELAYLHLRRAFGSGWPPRRSENAEATFPREDPRYGGLSWRESRHRRTRTPRISRRRRQT